jgi:hypothetical protein
MMDFKHKKLHFAPNLVPLALTGKKTSTWRLWDDKNLMVGDVVDFLESGSEKHFATAELVNVVNKKFGKLTGKDKEGHEKFNSEKEMFDQYSKYYQRKVDGNTLVKIITFKLVN